MHAHQCGLTAVGPVDGCGHTWWHPDQQHWNLVDHYCPKCGCGPFTMKKFIAMTEDAKKVVDWPGNV